MLNSGRHPAACQVDPAVSAERSISTTSVQPFFARCYSVLTPTAPPPITTTRACVLILCAPSRPAYLCSRSVEIGPQAKAQIATIGYPIAPRGLILPRLPPRGAAARGTVKPVDPTQTTRFVFLTLVNYSMIAVSNAVEPLRMANRVS